jgi:phage terminase small subunit
VPRRKLPFQPPPRVPISRALKQDKFARGIAAGLSEYDAMKEAGYPVDTKQKRDHTLSRLRKNNFVKTRIAEILDEYYPERHKDFAEIMKRQAQLAIESNDLKAVSDALVKRAEIEGLKPADKAVKVNLKGEVPLDPSGLPKLPS